MSCQLHLRVIVISPEGSESVQIPHPLQPENEEDEHEEEEEEGDGSKNKKADQNDDEYIHPLKGTNFNYKFFKEMEPKRVDKLPLDVNGNQLFIVDCTGKYWVDLQRELWHFKMVSTSRKGYTKKGPNGFTFKIGNCMGSWECVNKECEFAKHSKQPNRVNFTLEENTGLKSCAICGRYVKHIECYARKHTQYSRKRQELTIWHQRTHTCFPKQDHHKYDAYIASQVAKYPEYGTGKMAIAAMAEAMKEGDFSDVDEIAKKLSNKKRNQKMKRKYREGDPNYHLRNDWIAASELKERCDKEDKCLIYEINPKNQNNRPSFMFKSHRHAAKIMLLMDESCTKDTGLKEEAFYFDVMFNRTERMKTLTAWTYHPAVKAIVPLAVMEIEKESANNLITFWRCINSMLAMVSGKEEFFFMPRAFMCDEHNANKKSIAFELGEAAAARVVMCRYHFLSCAALKSKFVGIQDRARFLKISKRMCKAETVKKYKELRAQLYEICTRYNIVSWVHWWDARRKHIVPVYRHPTKYDANIAEAAQGGMKIHTHEISLNAAGMEDVCMFKYRAQEFKDAMENKIPVPGRGPNEKERAMRKLQQERRKIKHFGELLQSGKPEEILAEIEKDAPDIEPSHRAKHKAPEKDKGIQGKVKEKKQAEVNSSDEEFVLYSSASEPESPPPPKKKKKAPEPRAKRARKPNKDPDFTYNTPPGAKQAAATEEKGKKPKKITNKFQKALEAALKAQEKLAGKKPQSSSPGVPPKPNLVKENNPPKVVLQGQYKISRCQGCPNDILKKKDRMIFQRKAYRPRPSGGKDGQGLWFFMTKPTNIYFHLDMKCLKALDPTVKKENITADEAVFTKLSEADFNVLAEKGFLQSITDKMAEDVGESDDDEDEN